MGGRSKTVDIDRVALKKYLSKQKIGVTELSLSLGWANNYLSEILREKNPKSMSLATYKYLCMTLKVDEDMFLKKATDNEESSKENSKKSEPTPIVVNSGLTAEQFNALLQSISNLADVISKGLEKISATESSNAIIQGKIYGEITNITSALGVNTPNNKDVEAKAVQVKPSYVPNNGGKK